MHRKISIILIILLLLSSWKWYEVHQENIDIKKGAIEEFRFNQKSIESYLDQTITHKDDPNKVLFNLGKAVSAMDSNAMIAANGSFIGKHTHFPLRLFTINREKGILVYSAYEEALNGNLKDETLKDLIDYKERIEVITRELKESDIDSQSLGQLYKLLENIAKKL